MNDTRAPQQPASDTEQVWTCKIGAKVGELPGGADWPLRSAVMDAFQALTGRDCEFIFSGWGGKVTPLERAVLNDDDDAAIEAAEALAAPVAQQPASDLAEAAERWAHDDIVRGREEGRSGSLKSVLVPAFIAGAKWQAALAAPVAQQPAEPLREVKRILQGPKPYRESHLEAVAYIDAALTHPPAPSADRLREAWAVLKRDFSAPDWRVNLEAFQQIDAALATEQGA